MNKTEDIVKFKDYAVKTYQIKSLTGQLLYETTDHISFIKKQISLHQSGYIDYIVVIK